jgi:hypothetical protein
MSEENRGNQPHGMETVNVELKVEAPETHGKINE